MSGLREAITLLNQTAATTGTTAFALDYRNDPFQNRTIYMTLAAADTVKVQGSSDGTNWYDLVSHNTAASFVDTITGPHAFLRVVKTGALGNALVQGVI